MPFTNDDLRQWEEQGDVDKFIQILAYLTEDCFKDTRLKAVHAIGKMRNPRGLKSLLGALNDIDSIAEGARQELKHWGEEEAATLCDIIENPATTVSLREDLLNAIASNPSDRIVETFLTLFRRNEFIRIIQSVVKEFDYSDLLIKKLSHPDPETRFYILAALIGIQHHRDIFSSLIITMDDPDPQVRYLAARIISTVLRNKKYQELIDEHLYRDALTVLIAHLADEDYMVKATTITALPALDDRFIADKLITLLDDAYASVREAAVEALIRIPARQHYERLLLYFLEEENMNIRRLGVHAIASTGDPHVFEFLNELLESEPVIELRLAALEEIGKMVDQPKAIELLGNALYSDNTAILDETLQILYKNDFCFLPSLDPLIAALQEPFLLDQRSIYIILKLFKRMKDKEVIRPTLQLMGTEISRSLVGAAIEAITEIIKPTSIMEYLAALPETQDSIYSPGIERIKEYLQSHDDD